MGSPFFVVFIFLITLEVSQVMGAPNCGPILASDTDRIEFALNLEFLEAEFFLSGALGRGLDSIAPSYADGGPPPIGAKKANLDPLVAAIIEEFAYEEVGHLREFQQKIKEECKAQGAGFTCRSSTLNLGFLGKLSIITTIGGFPRPQLDLSPQNFANLFDAAVGFKLSPPFDPYLDPTNYLLASYVIPYVGLVGYVGTIPNLVNKTSLGLVASLLGVEAGQDAVIRTLLYERANQKVQPYNMTVAEFTIRLSALRNKLAMCGIKDEGIEVPLFLGAENRTDSNILSADPNSLSYSRTPLEILRIIYATGSEYKPGGFYPNGAGGKIANSFLKKA